MKTKIRSLTFGILLVLAIAGCKKDKAEIDTIYPEIDITSTTAFPKQCSIVNRGEKFMFKAKLSDNVALGNISIDIHHNFDHHSHSTEMITCGMDPVKMPIKPMVLIKSFSIPPGQKNYDIQEEIEVPTNVDTGDYHFLIRLTDHEGWQTIKGLSIKIN